MFKKLSFWFWLTTVTLLGISFGFCLNGDFDQGLYVLCLDIFMHQTGRYYLDL